MTFSEKQALEQEFLSTPSVQENLKGIILDHDHEIKKLEARRAGYIDSNRFEELGAFAREYRQRAFDEVLDGKNIPILQRQLERMCYLLKKTQGRFPKTSEWHKAYEYATEQAEIVPIMQRFMEIQNPRRSIRCPFHEDRSPSLKIYERTNSFYCFGCQIGGSPIDFVMKMQACDFKEAVHSIAGF